MYYEQEKYDIRLEWGERGITALAPISDAVVTIDILSFTTCVDICLSRGSTIFPFPWKGKRAEEFAQSKGALLASKRNKFEKTYSLAPSSLIKIPIGTKLVLPSPNGATLTLKSSKFCKTYAGCLRNAKSVAKYLQNHHTKITVILCGERWEDETIRLAIEDLIGAGAIIANLEGNKSPEAVLAESAYKTCENISVAINQCSSGVELHQIGFGADVSLAVELDSSNTIPRFNHDHYVNANC